MPVSVATPAASVAVEPTTLPFRVNVTMRPEIGAPDDVSTADNVVVPPKTPVAGETAMFDLTIVSRYTSP